jgi:V8-like Glu-specific endopeptidase
MALIGATALAAPGKGPQVIYGNDDRQDYYEVTDAKIRGAADSTVALMKAANLTAQGATTKITSEGYGSSYGLCSTEPYFDQETAAFCSGFLVADDLVVTAGHCISDQASCNDTRFVFGFKITQKGGQPHTVPTDDVFSCKTVVHSVSVAQGEDFAVVKLDRPVTKYQPLAYRSSGKIAVGEGLRVVGYPAGLPVKIAGGAAVRSLQPQFLVANLDTYGGNSGSAVFNTSTGDVEGVLVRGETDFVYANGCRSSNRCPDSGCRGEDVTLFERVLPYLK